MADASINTGNSRTSRPFWKKALGYTIIVGLACMVFVVVSDSGPVTCEKLVKDVVKMSKENAGPNRPKIIDLVEITTASNTDKELKCTGIGILSNGMKQNLIYGMYEEYEKWWVKFEPDGFPFK